MITDNPYRAIARQLAPRFSRTMESLGFTFNREFHERPLYFKKVDDGKALMAYQILHGSNDSKLEMDIFNWCDENRLALMLSKLPLRDTNEVAIKECANLKELLSAYEETKNQLRRYLNG